MGDFQKLKKWPILNFFLQVVSVAAKSGGVPSSTLASSVGSSTVQSTVSTSATVPPAIPTSVGASFPPVGSTPKDFSPAGLERLWDLVGPVEAPPFTTTRIPQTPIAVPTSPPPAYPEWFSPRPRNIFPSLKLKKGFLFGVSTAAYQVEGAAKNEGKGPTIWDWNSRQPGGVFDNTTGDVVDLQYYLYKEDIARIAALGVNAHSFSISWARIFPFGTADSPLNQAGLDHYSDLIDSHLQAGVEPVVTLFHWDTPLALQAYYGGFTSPNVVEDFVHYAKTVFQAFNGRVKTWYTFNEPGAYCHKVNIYPFNETLTPGVNASMAPYHCAYNLLRAHAGAVKAFRQMGISGEISYKHSGIIGPPWRANNTEDIEATERHTAFDVGVYSDPVYSSGDWPKIMTDTLPPSYLPRFTEQEKKDLLGSADFYAIDPYSIQYVRAPPDGLATCVSNTSHPLWPGCNVVVALDPTTEWSLGLSTPALLRPYLRELQRRWPTDKMYISEFGTVEYYELVGTDPSRMMDDLTRTNYYMTYLGEFLLAIHEDKIPIAGTFAWAMVDNAEWSFGTNVKFGIQHVNYTTLERTYKRSALSLSEFFKGRIAD